MTKFLRNLAAEAKLLYAYVRNDKKHIFDQLEKLVVNKQWHEALPLSRHFYKEFPEHPAALYNYARTLEGIHKYDQAANLYLRSYRLNQDDLGTQYRVFHCLLLAKDLGGFIRFADEVGKTSPDSLTVLERTNEFDSVTSTDAFRRLAKKYTP